MPSLRKIWIVRHFHKNYLKRRSSKKFIKRRAKCNKQKRETERRKSARIMSSDPDLLTSNAEICSPEERVQGKDKTPGRCDKSCNTYRVKIGRNGGGG